MILCLSMPQASLRFSGWNCALFGGSQLCRSKGQKGCRSFRPEKFTMTRINNRESDASGNRSRFPKFTPPQDDTGWRLPRGSSFFGDRSFCKLICAFGRGIPPWLTVGQSAGPL